MFTYLKFRIVSPNLGIKNKTFEYYEVCELIEEDI